MSGIRLALRVLPRAHHAVLVVLPLILLAPIVFGGRVLYWGVPLMQFYPWQHLAAETWRMGEVPLWNPLVGNGAPLAANLQTGVFYPLNSLHLLLPTEIAMGYTAVLHVVLAGLFMFALMRSLGVRRFSALVAAIAFQLSGFLIARLGFLSITVTLPWVAVWLWRTERIIRSGHVRDVMWLAVAVGLGLLAGHAQTALYGLLFFAGYAVWRSLTLSRRRNIESLRFLGVLMPRRLGIILLSATGMLLGVGLAAIQLVPAAELARASQRVGGLDYTFAMTHSYWPWRLLTLLSPDLFGNPAYGNFWGYDNYWENAAYIGLLPLALAGVAIGGWWRARKLKGQDGAMKAEHGRRKDEGGNPDAIAPNFQSPISSLYRLTPFFLLAAIASLVLALGWFTAIYPFLYRTLPGFSLFQGPARWLSVFTIALCVLSGIGAELVLRRRERGDLRRSAKWIVIGVALIGAGLASRGFLFDRAATFPEPVARLGLLIAVGGLLFGSRPSSDDRRFTPWSAAFVAVIAIDLLTAHAALNPAIDVALYRRPSASAVALHAEDDGRVFLFSADDEAVRQQFGIYLPFADFGPVGLEAWMDFRASLIANTSMIDGIPSAANFDSLLVSDSLQMREAVNGQPLDVALRLLSLMHVRFIASTQALALPVIHRSPVATIYRNDDALPRAWIVPAARVDADPLAAVLDPSFDPRTEVVLDQSSNAAPATSHELRFALHSLRDTPNTVTIRAASENDGYLILADTWYPGWRASIDGRPVPILRANGTFRTIVFPAGEHTVEFRYEPGSFSAGLWMSVASALIVVAGMMLSVRRR